MRLTPIVLMAALSGPAFGDYFTGNELKQQLLDSGRAVDEGMFRGYVAGVQDSWNGTLFCVPEDVLMSQSSAVVKKFISDNPKLWHKSAKELIAKALNDAYPCK